MITQKESTLIEAWNELNKTNNRIDLLETQIELAGNISSSKLKEVLTQCSFSSNDKFINTIIAKDNRIPELYGLKKAKIEYEKIVENEINRTKLTTPVVCVAFLREYKKMPWNDIAEEMGYSLRQVKRFYYEDYKGRTPSDNSYFENDVK